MVTPSRDKRTGIYYIRVRIPDKLKPYFVKNYGLRSEWKKPLVDHDSSERARSEAAAKRLWPSYYEEWETVKAAAEAGIAGETYRLSALQVSQLCAQWFAERLSEYGDEVPDAEQLELIGNHYMEVVDVNRQREEPSAQAVRTELRRHELLVLQARKLLVANRLPLLETSDAFADFCERLAQTGVELVRVLEARSRGDWSEPDLLRLSPLKTRAARSKGGETVSQLYESYKDERNLNERQLMEHARPINNFIEEVGDVAVVAATAADIRRHKDAEVERRQSQSSINGGLSILRRLFGYAVENGLITENPARDIRAAKNISKERPRRPWSLEEIQRLLDGPVHSDGVRPAGGKGEAAFWIPLVAIFSGARLEDIAQLRREDMQTSPEGSLYLDINDNHGKQVKSKTTLREVPIHRFLLQWGFREYVEQVAAKGADCIFPGVETYKGQVAKTWGQWFGRYKRDVLLVDPKDVRKDFHSFRHGFKDAARASGVPAEFVDRIQGHAPATVGGSYGVGYPVEVLADHMNRITYRGLDTSKLDQRST